MDRDSTSAGIHHNPPKTGDTANVALWIAVLVLSATGITRIRIWNKKKQVKSLGIEEKKEEKGKRLVSGWI